MEKKCTLLLALALALSLAACGGASQPEGTPAPTEEPTPEPTKEPLMAEGIIGEFDDASDTYTNEYLGIGCKVDDGWRVFSKEEIAELMRIDADSMTDEDLASRLENAQVVMPFYALSDDGLMSMSITVQDLGIFSSLIDEQSYLDSSVSQVTQDLEAAEVTDVETEVGTLTFLGEERSYIKAHGLKKFEDADLSYDLYELMVYVKTDTSMVVFTISSGYSENTEKVLDLFYTL